MHKRVHLAIGALLIVIVMATVLVTSRRPPEIRLLREQEFVRGQTWRWVLQLDSHDGEDLVWRVHARSGTDIQSRLVRGEKGICEVWIYPGFPTAIDVLVTASREGRELATRSLGRIEPVVERFEVRADPYLIASVESSEVVVRGDPKGSAGILPSLKLVRTDRAVFGGEPTPARWTTDGGWEWRRRVPYAEFVEAVELELHAVGSVRHRFVVDGPSLESAPTGLTVVNARPQRIVSDHGLALLLPAQRTPSPREAIAELRLVSDEPLAIVLPPRIVAPPASELGLAGWRVGLLPEPRRVVVPGSAPAGVPRALPDESPKWGPLPPLTLELATPPPSEPLPPRRLALSIVHSIRQNRANTP
ncbi:MAG: hypothetical protein AMXMBFR81_30110 [Chthonomonas sp.]